MGRDQSPRPARPIMRFQFTRPAWGATPSTARVIDAFCVSIHAPRMGRDASRFQICRLLAVSIHAPRMGRDRPRRPPGARRNAFQFTRPAWGATIYGDKVLQFCKFQFTRPAWGATTFFHQTSYLSRVSIHAPRMGRDLTEELDPVANAFQFTRPAWGATIDHVVVLDEKQFQFTRPAWGATFKR